MLTSLVSDKTQRSDLLDDWNTTARCRQPVVLRCELCSACPASCQYPWHWPPHSIALLNAAVLLYLSSVIKLDDDSSLDDIVS